MGGIDRLATRLIGDGEPPSGGDRLQVLAGAPDDPHQFDHGAAHAAQMRVIHPGADVHVEPDQREPAPCDDGQCLAQLLMPDAVLAVLAAGVGLVAVAMAEARIQAQPHRVTGRDFAELLQHVDRAGIDRDAMRHDGRERLTIQQVGGEHDVRVDRVRAGAHGVAGGQRAQHLAARHRIHLHALLPHQPQDVGVGTGLLREADGVEALQRGDALTDDRRVVHPKRRAMASGERAQLLFAGGGEDLRHLGVPLEDVFGLPQASSPRIIQSNALFSLVDSLLIWPDMLGRCRSRSRIVISKSSAPS